MARRRPLVRAAGRNRQIPVGDALALAGALDEAPIVTLASAATVAIGAAQANIIQLTGTTTITGFDSIAAGVRRTLRFSAALTLTHDTTKLILPRAANIVTVAGDVANFVSLGGGNWACIGYQRATAAGAKGDIGLENVDNTGDADKPISTATQTALDAKALRVKPSLQGPVSIDPSDTSSTDPGLVVNRGLANSSAVNIPQSMGLNFTDESTADRLSAQVFRLTYTRSAKAKGAPTAFDAMQVLSPNVNVNANFAVRGLVLEGPVVASGATLKSWTAVRIQRPTGDGAVTTSVALEIESEAGNCLFGTSSDNGRDVVQAAGSLSATGPVRPGQYTLSTLPSASAFSGYEIDVTDASGGPKRCRSNGTNWIILNTNTTVS